MFRVGAALKAGLRFLESRVLLGERLLDRERFVEIDETESDECDEIERLRLGAEEPVAASLLRFRLRDSSRVGSGFL